MGNGNFWSVFAKIKPRVIKFEEQHRLAEDERRGRREKRKCGAKRGERRNEVNSKTKTRSLSRDKKNEKDRNWAKKLTTLYSESNHESKQMQFTRSFDVIRPNVNMPSKTWRIISQKGNSPIRGSLREIRRRTTQQKPRRRKEKLKIGTQRRRILGEEVQKVGIFYLTCVGSVGVWRVREFFYLQSLRRKEICK